MAEIPLFPLKTVLLPGNRLPLKIFEPRYQDMVAACMREESAFGVILIYKGEETHVDSDIYKIGTTAKICDWEHRADGLLGITALGMERFEIQSTSTQADGLTLAEIGILEDANTRETPEQFHYMRDLLDHISAQASKTGERDPSFSEILYRLIYLLPLEVNLKQRLLEIPQCSERAVILHAELIRLGVINYVKPESTLSD